MKKLLFLSAMVSIAVSICLGLTGCDLFNKPSEHTHTFASEWTSDETHHWHAATCEHTNKESEKAEHSFVDGSCSVCGRKREDQQPQEHTHTYEDGVCTICGLEEPVEPKRTVTQKEFEAIKNAEYTNYVVSVKFNDEPGNVSYADGKAYYSDGYSCYADYRTSNLISYEYNEDLNIYVKDYSSQYKEQDFKYPFKDEGVMTLNWEVWLGGERDEPISIMNAKREGDYYVWSPCPIIGNSATLKIKFEDNKLVELIEITDSQNIMHVAITYGNAQITLPTEQSGDPANCTHVFDKSKITYPTCDNAGSINGTCLVCDTTVNKTVAATGHSYSSYWAGNDEHHWHACYCGAKKDKGTHNVVDGVCSICKRIFATETPIENSQTPIEISQADFNSLINSEYTNYTYGVSTSGSGYSTSYTRAINGTLMYHNDETNQLYYENIDETQYYSYVDLSSYNPNYGWVRSLNKGTDENFNHPFAGQYTIIYDNIQMVLYPNSNEPAGEVTLDLTEAEVAGQMLTWNFNYEGEVKFTISITLDENWQCISALSISVLYLGTEETVSYEFSNYGTTVVTLPEYTELN